LNKRGEQTNVEFFSTFHARSFLCALLLAASLRAAIPTCLSSQTTDLSSAASLIQQGNLSEAEQKLEAYLRAHPHSARANTLLGTACLKQGQLQRAVQALQKAIADAPSSLEARLALGDAFLAQGKLDDATAAYQAGVKIAPADARFNLALAKLYLGQGQFARS